MSEEVQTEEVVETTEEVSNEEVQETTEATSFVDSMLSQIDNEDVKSAGFWKNLAGKDANEVGQYIKELQSFAGKKGDIPKSDAKEEEWNAFYKKMGRPDSIEGYDFGINDDFKEIVGSETAEYFAQSIEDFKSEIFKLGATPKAAEDLVDWYLERSADQIQEANKIQEANAKEKEEELQKAWGDSYKGMQQSIEALLKANGMEDEHIEWAKSSGILSEPTLAITLGNIASKLGDDPEIGHHQTKTMAGIRDQLAEVEMDVANYIRTGQKIPAHIAQKRQDLMNKLGDDL